MLKRFIIVMSIGAVIDLSGCAAVQSQSQSAKVSPNNVRVSGDVTQSSINRF